MVILGAGIITELHVLVYSGLVVLVIALGYWYIGCREIKRSSGVD
jgi:hypothetical protein